MLISLQDLLNKYNLHPIGVIHVGAHWAEEHGDYIKCGIERFVYIEPCKDAFMKMVDKINDERVIMIRCACGAKEEQAVMFVSHDNQGQSNSLLEPKLHLEQHKEVVFNDAEIVRVMRLDDLKFKKEYYDMLVMDCQGAEGLVLAGATETLKHINIIYTEVNNGQTYSGNMEIDELDKVLKDFERIETYWPSPSWTWGDAVYIRRKQLTSEDLDMI